MNPPLFASTNIFWHLPILLIVVSLVYSATRHDKWNQILYEAGRWGLRMGVFLGGIALVLFLLSTYL
jgi:hypothetical protein